MNRNLITNRHHHFHLILLIVLVSILAACSPGKSSPQEVTAVETMLEEKEAVSFVEVETVGEGDAAAEGDGQESAAADVPLPTMPAANSLISPAGTPSAAIGQQSSGPSPHISRPYDRLIVKNAQVGLLVEDTDSAINRAIGIVVEYDGYIINNRTWFDEKQKTPQTRYKNATLTIGVPVQNFEEMLGRLKELAVIVTNETITGQDVSDQYVDLESRLVNLESTAGRIRDFLKEAKDVDKALEVSNKLGQVEAEIEQVKGRMNYLKDKSAFSTITLEIRPQIPTPTPAPTFTPTPTPTATATPTATPAWSAASTFNQASGFATTTATSAFQVTVDLLIWGVLVILPCLVPLALLFWLGHRLTRRFLTVK